MTEQNGSKKWMVAVRIIMVLLGIINVGLMTWAKYITKEVIDNKSEVVTLRSDLGHIKEDVGYIRTRLDTLFDERKK